jgi:phage baseplate assembly protein W
VTFSLAVSDGDLVQEGSSLQIVWGIEKLKQDLQLWVLERHGGDRFHPGMGSILQDMIGTPVSAVTEYRITHELLRVLDNYQRTQYEALEESPQLFSATELLLAVDDVTVKLTFDTAMATVKVRTAANDAATINFTQEA